MIFKCEKVDENLRKEIIETEKPYYGLKEATHWWVNDTRDIIAWEVEPHPGKFRDGDFSIDFLSGFPIKMEQLLICSLYNLGTGFMMRPQDT